MTLSRSIRIDSCPLDFLQIMGETLKDPVIKRCCEAPNRLSDLQNISEGLEKCQKSLNDYLDSKRNAFPRFFFISDDELLSILGNSDPLCVQEHMIKVGPQGLPWECPHKLCNCSSSESATQLGSTRESKIVEHCWGFYLKHKSDEIDCTLRSHQH